MLPQEYIGLKTYLRDLLININALKEKVEDALILLEQEETIQNNNNS